MWKSSNGIYSLKVRQLHAITHSPKFYGLRVETLEPYFQEYMDTLFI